MGNALSQILAFQQQTDNRFNSAFDPMRRKQEALLSIAAADRDRRQRMEDLAAIRESEEAARMRRRDAEISAARTNQIRSAVLGVAEYLPPGKTIETATVGDLAIARKAKRDQDFKDARAAVEYGEEIRQNRIDQERAVKEEERQTEITRKKGNLESGIARLQQTSAALDKQINAAANLTPEEVNQLERYAINIGITAVADKNAQAWLTDQLNKGASIAGIQSLIAGKKAIDPSWKPGNQFDTTALNPFFETYQETKSEYIQSRASSSAVQDLQRQKYVVDRGLIDTFGRYMAEFGADQTGSLLGMPAGGSNTNPVVVPESVNNGGVNPAASVSPQSEVPTQNVNATPEDQFAISLGKSTHPQSSMPLSGTAERESGQSSYVYPPGSTVSERLKATGLRMDAMTPELKALPWQRLAGQDTKRQVLQVEAEDFIEKALNYIGPIQNPIQRKQAITDARTNAANMGIAEYIPEMFWRKLALGTPVNAPTPAINPLRASVVVP